MNREETKKKIVDILVNCKSDRCAIEYCAECDGNPCIENCREQQFADILIAEGLRFGENLTATFDHMALAREHDLERRLAEAEHRAEVAERALQLMARGECTFASPECYREQAEKELSEEKK